MPSAPLPSATRYVAVVFVAFVALLAAVAPAFAGTASLQPDGTGGTEVRFEEVTDFQRDVYVVTLLFSALTTALLIAPSAYHRLNFRRGDKEHIVNVASGLTIAGLVSLSFAMSGAVLLVMDWLLDGAIVGIIFGAVALAFVVLWFVLPLRRRMHKRAVSSEG